MVESHDTPSDMDALRARGLRATPQRLMILEALRTGHGHVTVHEIVQFVHRAYPSVNVATIYRALDDLHVADMVDKTDLGQKGISYELVRQRHHHVICERCGGIAAIDDDVLESVKTALRTRYQFHARMDHFAIFGTCAHCVGQPGDVETRDAGSIEVGTAS
jgi:Fur family transcriptional regulator, ferric uptake regulator